MQDAPASMLIACASFYILNPQKMRNLLLFIVACCLSFQVHAQIYVVEVSSGMQNGTSWADAYTDLQTAIYNANAGDTIWVAQGSYKPFIDTLGNIPAMPANRYFWLKNGVVVYGGFSGSETSLSQRDPITNKAVLEGEITTGVFAEHVMYVYAGIDSSAVLDGFIVQNGKSFVSSTEKNGSGLLLRGDATFTNIEFKQNETYNQGGAVYAESSASKFVSCRFEGNTTIQYDGGAANFVYSDIKMYNCVFYDNHANRFGAAITTVESDVLIQNGTFVGNTGGQNVFQFSTSGDIHLNNCIFTGDNTASTVLGTSGGSALFRECLMPFDNGWLILCPTCTPGTPAFTNGPSGDFSLMAGSDGIDDTLAIAPVNAYADILGNPRSVGYSIDMGAYEFQNPVGIGASIATVELRAYPSPTSSLLTVECPSTVEAIAIYDATGRKVLASKATTFSVADLPAGMYFVQVKTNEGFGDARFVKE
jgi:trimeric autotransporter adhesin